MWVKIMDYGSRKSRWIIRKKFHQNLQKNRNSHEKMQSSPSHLSLIELKQVVSMKINILHWVNTRNYSIILHFVEKKFPFLFSPSFVQQVQCFIVVDNSRSGGEGEKATNYSNYTIALSHSRTLSLLLATVEIINKSRSAENHQHRRSTQLRKKRDKNLI